MLYKLSETTPIAEGGEKYIFRCPGDEQLVIKIWKDRYYDLVIKRYPYIHKISRAPKYISLTNEVLEHIVMRGNKQDGKHVQDIVGFCDTDMGLGLLVRAVNRRNGELALTLGQLVDNKLYHDHHQYQLNEFVSWLRETKVIIRDLTVNNVVWCEFTETFIVIDGIGPRPLPSLRKISVLYNQRANNKRADKLLNRVAERIRKANLKE